MKSFFKGLLFAAIGGAIDPVVNQIAHGNLSPKALATGSAVGAAGMVWAYLHPSPKQQTITE